jgi:hypothetical protein
MELSGLGPRWNRSLAVLRGMVVSVRVWALELQELDEQQSPCVVWVFLSLQL